MYQKMYFNVMKSTLFEYENQIKEHVVPEITRASLVKYYV